MTGYASGKPTASRIAADRLSTVVSGCKPASTAELYCLLADACSDDGMRAHNSLCRLMFLPIRSYSSSEGMPARTPAYASDLSPFDCLLLPVQISSADRMLLTTMTLPLYPSPYSSIRSFA